MAVHAQPLVLDVIDADVIRTFVKFNTFMPEHIRVGLIESMEYVGITSVQKYMTVRKVVDKATGKVEGRKSASEPLGIVTSRLSRSILGKESNFGNEAIRRIVTDGKDLYAEMGSKTPYAAIHEYGGKTGKGGATRIPARPYLNPALADSEEEIFAILKLKLQLAIQAAESGE